MRALDDTTHRPWPLPPGPWIMAQSWHDLLFAHWPMAPETLRGKLPSGARAGHLLRDGVAGHRPLPDERRAAAGHAPLPRALGIPRAQRADVCHVRGETRRVVLSLDAGSWLAVAVARAWFRLPYYSARMSCTRDAEDVVYTSLRTQAGTPRAQLAARYRPRGDCPGLDRHARALADRALLPLRAVPAWRGDAADIDHPPWPLQPAEAVFEKNTMAQANGIELPASAPLLHFARRQDVVVWAPQRATSPQTT